MAIETLRFVVDEIRTSIKQTFDDKDVSRAQVAYWVIVVANRMLGQHNLKRDSGKFLVPFVGVPVEVAADNNERFVIKGRKFVRLPAGIFDYDMDGGIDYISFYNPDENCKPEHRFKTVFRTTLKELQWFEKNKNTAPSPENPYFYVNGEIVYIAGIEGVPVKEIEMGLFVTIDPVQKIDIDKPFFFPQELLDVLKKQVTDLARYSFLFKKDNGNDGEDSSGQQNIPKIVSVNDPNNQ